MKEYVQVPVKEIVGARWGQLNALADKHEICAEEVRLKQENFSLAGGHRVRLYTFKKNVHWKIPDGVELDISGVAAEPTVRRRTQK
jgi:hypothetical protein